MRKWKDRLPGGRADLRSPLDFDAPSSTSQASAECRLCGKQFKGVRGLTGHLRQRHQKSGQDYYDVFVRAEGGEGICALPLCEKPTTFLNLSKGYNLFCSNRCAQLSEEVQAKIEKAHLARYGAKRFTNPEKRAATKAARYGSASYNNAEQIGKTLAKRSASEKEDWRERVRVAWRAKEPAEVQIIQARRRTVAIERHGADAVDIRKHVRRLYGVENISQTEEGKRKISAAWGRMSPTRRREIQDKREATTLRKHGVACVLTEPRVRAKAMVALREEGHWAKESDIRPLARYRNKVYALTRKTAKLVFTEEELSQLGCCGVPGALQVDHVFSIRDGFDNRIPPKVIATPSNLALVPWEANDKKKRRSGKGIQSLLSGFCSDRE